MRLDTTRERLERFMQELGNSVQSPARIYFAGGAYAVLLGWRDMTLDVDIKADPEPAGFYETLPKLKESLQINIELASPDLFVPPCRAGRTALDSSPDTEWSIFITTTFMDRLWLKSNGITPGTAMMWGT